MSTLRVIWANFEKQVKDSLIAIKALIIHKPANAIIGLLFLLLGSFVVWMAIWADNFPAWVGFGAYDMEAYGPRAKTLWEWMDLLIIPVFLSFAIVLINHAMQKQEKQLSQDRLRQETLKVYLNTMQDLLLNHKLYQTDKNSDVRFVAMAYTDNIWQQLDPKQKGFVLEFLYKTNLIQCEINSDWSIKTSIENPRPIIAITKADLSRIILSRGLWGASVLKNIYLTDVDLGQANLSGINFQGSVLRNCWFSNSNLERIDLRHCDLRGSVFWDANLKDADLRGANLEMALIGKKELELVKSLHGAIMFNGSLYDPDRSLEEQTYIKLNKSQ